MTQGAEKFIQAFYRQWKRKHRDSALAHPSEEDLACFLEGKADKDQWEIIQAHLSVCRPCLDSLLLQVEDIRLKRVPKELVAMAKALVRESHQRRVFEVALKLKDGLLELLNSTGEVFWGDELLPLPVLRSRSIKDFKDQVTLQKEFDNFTVEIKIEKRGAKSFSLSVTAKDKLRQEMVKEMRVTLIKDDLELESYLSDSGKVIFEHVDLGNYIIELSTIDEQLASIIIDLKK